MAPPLAPAVAGLVQHARPLRAVVSRALQLHPEDESDNVLAVVFALLERAGNRAMSVKELGEAAFAQGYLRTSPSAAGQAIGTHIRNHIARHADAPWTQLLSSYKLEGGTPDEEARIGGAVYCASLASCRRGTTVWYMSRAAGKPCPFERIGVSVPQPVDPNAPPPTTSSSPPLSGLKRKIPPDEAHDGTRPAKIRITLRLPPRKPIPKRPRPIHFPTPSISDSDCDDDDDDESSTGQSGSGSSSSSDEEMLVDDFNTLLATDVPIAIPCPARAALASTFTGHRRQPSHHHHHHHHHHRQSSLSSLDPASFVQQFFDTCEPPPDSEDDDDDFHNSMLRPNVDEQLQAVKEELDVDAIEMDDDELLLHFKTEDFLDLDIKEEELVTPPPATEPSGEMTAHPELDWSGVKVDEGVFSPLEMLVPPGGDSSAATALQTPVTATPFIQSTFPLPSLVTARAIRAAMSRHSSISAPPPTPWIKTEEDPLLFPSRLSPDGLSILEEDELLSNPDAFFPNPSTSPDPRFPEASSSSPAPILPSEVDLLRPWESETWAPIPGPESVSTDDVDSITYTDVTDDVTAATGLVQPSTSAPSLNRSSLSFPIPVTSRILGTNGRAPKPPRLSMSALTTLNKHHNLSRVHGHGGHARRHSHAAGVTTKNRRLSVISTAFSDWTSTGTPEDAETSAAPLATPSHTGWRMFPWPPAAPTPTLAATPAPCSVAGGVSENEEKASVEKEDVSMASPQEASPLVPLVNDETTDDELHRCLSAPTFNQVLQKTLPTGVRISTLLLLGIPVFQCRIDSPPIELIRRMDTDYVNISTIMSLAQHLAQATATRFRSNSSATNASTSGTSAVASTALPTPPPAEELPPNHVYINSGARVIHGGWVSLSTARSVVKNYHDLPAYIRRVFLADQLAEKFPEPIRHVKAILTARQASKQQQVGFGKPFANPSSLSAHELLVSVTLPPRTTPRSAAEAGANLPLAASGVVVPTPSAPTTMTARGAPLALKTKAAAAAAAARASFPLSPIDAVTNANVQLGRVNANGVHHGAAIAQQNIMSLTDPMGEHDKPWTTLLGKTMVEPKEEEPLKPEEEEILKAILKSPPRSQVLPKDVEEEGDSQEMCVDDELEEEEVARGVVDLSSDVEREDKDVGGQEAEEEQEEEEEPTIRMSTRSARKRASESAPPKQVSQTPSAPSAPAAEKTTRRRNLRHVQSVSSVSSELTVSESESSAPPPSLDSRPALKGKSTNHPLVPTSSSNMERAGAVEDVKKESAASLRSRAARARGRGRVKPRGVVTHGAENGPRVRIIEVEEPSRPSPTSDAESSGEEEEESSKPRRSVRITKQVHPTNATADRATKRASLKEKPAPAPTTNGASGVEKSSKTHEGTRTRGKRASTPVSEASSERVRRRQTAARH